MSFAEHQNRHVVPKQVLQANHDHHLGINTQAGLDSILTRKAWATMYKLSAPLLDGVVGAT
eukprot:1758263-Pyramimonas_sp.AAC.1